MCQFPSWVEQDDGTVLFLTDKDISRLPGSKQGHDAIGHTSVRTIYPKAGGKDVEGWEKCPAVIRKAIRAGKMQRLAKAAGVTVLFPRSRSHISPKRNEIYLIERGLVFVDDMAGGYCWFYDTASGTVSGQSGGECTPPTKARR